jgi:hypothetical protein
MRQPSRTLIASESLVPLLIRGDTTGPERLRTDLWRYAPVKLDRDYPANQLRCGWRWRWRWRWRPDVPPDFE